MIVGLTGGIGSGKSTVARIFEVLGCTIFNSDDAAKEVYYEDQVKQKVLLLLGSDAYLADGSINKKLIADRIFNDPLLLHKINSIIHPAVKERTKAFMELNAGKIIIKESALLFEASLDKEVDHIIVVTAPDELRIRRVMERDNLSHAEVESRIRNQMPQDDKAARAHSVISNDEKELLIPQCLKIFGDLKKLAG